MRASLGKFEWKLSKHEILSLIEDAEESKHKDPSQIARKASFRSDEFSIHGTNFYLSCFANGYNRSNAGWVNLFLNISKLPPKANGIHARISLHCNQMGTHFVTVQDFSTTFNNIGWTDYALKAKDVRLYLNDQAKADYIVFEVKIELLRITYCSTFCGNIAYQHHFKMIYS